MQAVTDSNRRGVLDSLIHHRVASVLEPSDEAFAQIQAMQTNFDPVRRTPETIRICSQLEFDYTGVINRAPEALEDSTEWYQSSFVVADYSKPEPWLTRAIRECLRGKTVVMMLPARTHTKWFHELVLEEATQVRFIQGKVKHGDNSYDIPEILAVFKRDIKPSKKQRRAKNVAILKMKTSFTETEVTTSI